MIVLMSFMMACGDGETTYACTEEEVLQECDSNGDNCQDLEDCTEREMICHAEMGHCMPIENEEGEEAGDVDEGGE
ncbi:MAG: hypothetical protein CMK59_07360 [Proteobacteria bacterium]|nr:hypothetical protein [Pseudomonadota bacterium]